MRDTIINKRTQIIIYLILYCCFVILAVNILDGNPEQILIISIYLGSYITISFFRHLLVKNDMMYYILPICEAAIIIVVNYLDVTSRSQFLFIIIVADIIVGYTSKYCFPYISCFFICFVISNITKAYSYTVDDIVQFIFVSCASYLLVLAVIIVAKKQMVQSQKLKNLMRDLEGKTEELKEMAVIKERNRIAGEIHDTVGHTLTTVLIEIEAGRMLIDKNPYLAKEKLQVAKTQVKNGLKDIRTSVSTIKDGGNLLDFVPSLKAMLKETQKHTDIKIMSKFNVQSKLLPIQEKILYRAIQESITNGIKHGSPTQINIIMEEYNKKIKLSIRDNGRGTEKVILGFGLTSMRERVESFGGTLDITSSLNNGFSINIMLPIGDIENGGSKNG